MTDYDYHGFDIFYSLSRITSFIFLYFTFRKCQKSRKLQDLTLRTADSKLQSFCQEINLGSFVKFLQKYITGEYSLLKRDVASFLIQ